MPNRTVMIGTPSLDGSLLVQYVSSLMMSRTLLDQNGIQTDVNFLLQSSLIMEARNSIVADFLESRADDLVFIDADIQWDPQGLLRLLNHDAAVVSGAYRRKSEPLSFPIRFPGGATVTLDRRTGLMEASRVGCGFLRLRRDALQTMTEKLPQLRYNGTRPDGSKRSCWALFDTSLVDGELCGEDYTFCDRWRSVGGQVWLDPEIVLKHIGNRAWEGSIKEAFTRNA